MDRTSVPAPGPSADASDPSDPSHRAGRHGPGRRWRGRGRGWSWAGSGLLWTFALLLGAVAFWSHHTDWVGHNGDHYYYASTALQYAGVDYDTSLREATEYFHYPFDANRLDLGYLNPMVAPLIYPRVVLGLLALPAVQRYGISGVWFPGALCGVLALLAATRLAGRRVGPVGLLAVPVLIGVTRYAPEFMFGIYLEAPVILATVAMLLAFPLGGARRTWGHVAAAVGLVPVMMLSRQVPLLPVGMVLGGWLWAAIGARRLRNRWLPYALTVTPVTVVSYYVLARWAPYDALPYLYDKTRSSTVEQLWARLPAMWRQSLGVDWQDLLQHDQAVLWVTGLGLLGLLLALRNPIAGVFLGSAASGAVTELLNGQPNAFRYLSPSLPPLLLLAALLLAWTARRAAASVSRLFGLQTPAERARRWGPDWPGGELIRPEPRTSPQTRWRLDPRLADQPPTRWVVLRVVPVPAGLLPTLGVWAGVAALLVGAVQVHRPAPIDRAPRLAVSVATFKGQWPFTVPQGTVVCGGHGYQLWFLTPDGGRYALSGTAMADSLRTPRALLLAPDRVDYGWPQLKPLITAGMRLCRPDRGFQSGKP